MTLCTAHIRQVNDTEELVFATDSCLTGGEKWKHTLRLIFKDVAYRQFMKKQEEEQPVQIEEV